MDTELARICTYNVAAADLAKTFFAVLVALWNQGCAVNTSMER